MLRHISGLIGLLLLFLQIVNGAPAPKEPNERENVSAGQGGEIIATSDRSTVHRPNIDMDLRLQSLGRRLYDHRDGNVHPHDHSHDIDIFQLGRIGTLGPLAALAYAMDHDHQFREPNI
jgi:hypothetical protein